MVVSRMEDGRRGRRRRRAMMMVVVMLLLLLLWVVRREWVELWVVVEVILWVVLVRT